MIGDIVVSLDYNVLYNSITKKIHLNNQISEEIVAIETFMDYQISVSKTGTVYITLPPLTVTKTSNL